jgi:fermentation-respiration switch protein FrsA (DUF1100 family)
MKKMLEKILIGIVLGLIVINAWFYFMQPGMLFYPYKDIDQTPKDWGLAYEDVLLTTADGVSLHAWFLPVKKSNRVLLFFHGNAGNISHRGDSLEIFHRLGLNVLIMDYRGYGKSGGKVSETGVYNDAMAAWKYLIEERNYQANEVILFGRSLGGAVAANLASKVRPGALIIESTFSSVRDMANISLPFISRIVWLRYKFDTETMIKQNQSPLLVLHSVDDEMIPFSLGEKIHAAANSPKEFYKMRGGHNDGFFLSQPGYEQAIRSFLAD